jgi:hypothetical protein
VRLHQLDRADYTPRNGCPWVTIPDRTIRFAFRTCAVTSQLP